MPATYSAMDVISSGASMPPNAFMSPLPCVTAFSTVALSSPAIGGEITGALEVVVCPPGAVESGEPWLVPVEEAEVVVA
ncbi:MAG: hypothetical protein ACYC33_02890 [Thermoleophilia bacterium]